MDAAVQNELSQFAVVRGQTLAITADLSQDSLDRSPGPAGGRWGRSSTICSSRSVTIEAKWSASSSWRSQDIGRS